MGERLTGVLMAKGEIGLVAHVGGGGSRRNGQTAFPVEYDHPERAYERAAWFRIDRRDIERVLEAGVPPKYIYYNIAGQLLVLLCDDLGCSLERKNGSG